MVDQSTSQSDLQKTLQIGVAIVLKGDQVAVGVRQTGTHLPGKHEFPGGKCEFGESAAECTIRECREETGLAVDIQKVLLRQRFDYPDRSVDLSFFLCRPVDGGDRQELIAPFEWIPIFDLASLDFPAANSEVIDLLLDRFHTSRDSRLV